MKGIIAAGHELTAEAGVEAFREGGNAFDAALAAAFASFVCESALTSPGGGGFMTLLTGDGEGSVYDFFVNTPGLGSEGPAEKDFIPVHIDFADTLQEIYIGRASSGVPGVMAGLQAVHEDRCTLPLSRLMAPAIRYAREGVRLTRWQAYFHRLLSKMLETSEETRGIYAPEGRLLEEGEVIFHRQMADIFEHLAEEGLHAFYSGPLAERLLEAFGPESGGLITAEDLSAYRVFKRKPLQVDYRGRAVLTNPPPSSGGILIAFALKLLEGFDLGALGHGSARSLELLMAAMRAADSARREVFDRRVYEEGIVAELLSLSKVEEYRGRFFGVVPDESLTGNTTHISVIDARGNVASVTTSAGMGCGFMIPGTGIMMNNMLGEKDLNPAGFHTIPAGRRMSSMMAPTIVVRDGLPEAVLGSGGSRRIRSAILQVLVNIIDYGLDPERAVNSPRIHLDGDLLHVEEGMDDRVVEALEATGVRIKRWTKKDMFFGGVHTVIRRDSRLEGAGDRRRGGAVRTA